MQPGWSVVVLQYCSSMIKLQLCSSRRRGVVQENRSGFAPAKTDCFINSIKYSRRRGVIC